MKRVSGRSPATPSTAARARGGLSLVPSYRRHQGGLLEMTEGTTSAPEARLFLQARHGDPEILRGAAVRCGALVGARGMGTPALGASGLSVPSIGIRKRGLVARTGAREGDEAGDRPVRACRSSSSGLRHPGGVRGHARWRRSLSGSVFRGEPLVWDSEPGRHSLLGHLRWRGVD